MPTYAYLCPAGHEFERFERKISDKSRVKCPTCGKMAQRQISGGAGIHFKGSGFYITDYKRAGEKRETSEGSKPEAKGTKDAKKPDTKAKGE